MNVVYLFVVGAQLMYHFLLKDFTEGYTQLCWDACVRPGKVR